MAAFEQLEGSSNPRILGLVSSILHDEMRRGFRVSGTSAHFKIIMPHEDDSYQLKLSLDMPAQPPHARSATLVVGKAAAVELSFSEEQLQPYDPLTRDIIGLLQRFHEHDHMHCLRSYRTALQRKLQVNGLHAAGSQTGKNEMQKAEEYYGETQAANE